MPCPVLDPYDYKSTIQCRFVFFCFFSLISMLHRMSLLPVLIASPVLPALAVFGYKVPVPEKESVDRN